MLSFGVLHTVERYSWHCMLTSYGNGNKFCRIIASVLYYSIFNRGKAMSKNKLSYNTATQ